MRYIKNILPVCFCMIAFPLLAQRPLDTLQGLDEVDIVKAYEPILITSNKVPFAPNLPTLVKAKPDAQSYIFSDVKGKVDYRPEDIRPIKAATQKAEKNQFFYAKIGMGYPLTPLVQLIITNPVQTKYRAGLDADFIYTKSNKIRYQQYTDLKLRGFGEVFIKKAASVGAEIYYRMDRHFFYGYSDVISTKDSLQTNYSRFGAAFKIRGIKDAPYYYNVDIGFNSAINKNVFHHPKEFSVNVNAESGYTIKEHYTFGARLMINNTSFTDDTVHGGNQNHFTVQAIPYGKIKFKIWQLMAGPNIIITNRHFYILPEIVNQLQIYKDYFVMYNEWKTQVKINSMNNLSLENPFLLTSNYNNTIDETRTFGGFRGTFKGFGYDVRFSQLVSTTSAEFFTNTYSTLQPTDATFDVRSVNIKAWNPHFSLSYNKGNMFGIKAWFDYFIYNKSLPEELSYLPTLKAGASAFYNWKDRLYINLDIYGQNKVTALQINHQPFSDPRVYIPLNGLIDLNLSATYYITKNIGVFADFNNLAIQKWQRFYRYPTYGYQVIAGVKLSF
ncbi:MAG: hypothetical protein JWN78_1025 [Bacteroidota bacterium]|nr:hypothetical protein [Bacteroidota bacterium]